MSQGDENAEAKKAVLEVVRQLVTQILTLSTSLIAATAAFATLTKAANPATWQFQGVLVALSFSVAFGLLSLGATISHLHNSGELDVLRSKPLSVLVALQMLTFAAGLFFVGQYAVVMVRAARIVPMAGIEADSKKRTLPLPAPSAGQPTSSAPKF